EGVGARPFALHRAADEGRHRRSARGAHGQTPIRRQGVARSPGSRPYLSRSLHGLDRHVGRVASQAWVEALPGDGAACGDARRRHGAPFQVDRRAPLVDPFAGSGTILIEAALIARNVAPGLSRPAFAFERLPGHDARAWERLKDEARRASLNTPRKKLILRGAEKDAATHAGAIENLRSAGFEGELEIERCDALDLELKRGWNAWIVTNPPYGERVGDEAALRELYHRFAAHLRERASGYHVALLSGNPRLARALGFDGASTM